MNSNKETNSGFYQDIFNVPEGLCILRYPSKMSKEQFIEFTKWIKLELRKIKRGFIEAPQDRIGLRLKEETAADASSVKVAPS